jgi:hypothetical protein
MESAQSSGVHTFPARSIGNSSGWEGIWQIFVLIFGIYLVPILILWLLAGMDIVPSPVPPFVTVLVAMIAIAIVVPFFFLIRWANRVASGVRYEVSDHDLTLIGGPVRYTIPLNTIKRVYKRDLDLRLRNRARRGVTGVRMPNLALGPVRYNDTGPLKMCATSSWKDITLIETTNGTYGITPADEEGFKAAIGAAEQPC